HHTKHPCDCGLRDQSLVGGPGFDPGASRSRTVLVACPRVSRRLRRCPSELKLPRPSCPFLCPAGALQVPGICAPAVPRRRGARCRWPPSSSLVFRGSAELQKAAPLRRNEL